VNIISMSGGKDSTATAILALQSGEPCKFVFADTGHEHEMTYEYINYLREALNIEIDVVRADFSKEIARKREVVRNKWVNEGAVTPEQAESICELLVPTGIPFLDLCIWKGRFPSTRARFCSEHLKHHPLDMYLLGVRSANPSETIVSWQGVRADESPARAKLPEREMGEHEIEIYRPILHWTAEQVFDCIKSAGLEPNPLYKLGMSRVGCMPCIHARKSEVAEIARRFPEEVSRVAEWESIVSRVSKRGNSTFFHARTDPTVATKINEEINQETHGIHAIADWAKTARGGRQYDLLASEDVPMCSSAYGLCE